MPKPELLAPGGSEESLAVAVENGADAVYFGVTGGKANTFNARVRAKNIPLSQLGDTVASLHRSGVKAYLTLNTLAFTEELPQIGILVREFAQANVDAVLVQDLGVARLAHEMCPDLPLHASTQMSLSSADSLALAERYGVKRVVLPRELSIPQIRLLHEELKNRNINIELEAFAHGALCMSYSGQCFASLFLGERGTEVRSANRGSCAQPCRMLYTLVGEKMTPQRLFSPTDLASLELIGPMCEAGIVSLKIEGRLKPPQYVAETTRIYRNAIDSIFDKEKKSENITENLKRLALTFSRGFSTGWLEGYDPRKLVPGNIRAHRGTPLGTVLRVQRDAVLVRLCDSVRRGDGVMFENEDRFQNPQGGRVYEIFLGKTSVKQAKADEKVLLTFGNGIVDTTKIEPGQEIRKTDDPKMERDTRKYRPVKRRVPLYVKIRAIPGEFFQLEAKAENGAKAEMHGDTILETAQKHPLTPETLREQFGRLGETIFELKTLDAVLNDGSKKQAMLPLSVLGRFRRDMIAALESYDTVTEHVLFEKTLEKIRKTQFEKFVIPESQQSPGNVFHLLFRDVRYFEDRTFLQRCVNTGCRSFYAEMRNRDQWRLAEEAVRLLDAEFIAVTPRILKPGETKFLETLAALHPDAVLVRNFGAMKFFQDRGVSCIADFSLNIVNDLAFSQMFELGTTLCRITPGFDLDEARMDSLLERIPTDRVEWILQGRGTLFAMEHCLWKANLVPPGQNCRKMCEKHPLKVRDGKGAVHTVRSDVMCRNFLENATPLEIPKSLRKWMSLGLKNFRIEWDEKIRNEKEVFTLVKQWK